MEFQAIILAAGRGTRMTELTSHVAKCLLPIGNKPMIWYPIRMFEKAGFAEINIVTLKSLESKLETELKVNCGIRTKLNFVYVNDDDEENFDEGTASVLSLLKDKISKDCMIVSCDLIANVSIQLMANFYRAKNASFVMLLADTSEQNIELSIPGQKGKYSPENDLIGLDIDSKRVLYMDNQEDTEVIKLKAKIALKYPHITWTSKLKDAHFYIIKKSIIDYIIDNKKICSLKGDFIPFLVRKQFSSHLKHLKKQYLQQSTKQETTPETKTISATLGSSLNNKPKLFNYLGLKRTDSDDFNWNNLEKKKESELLTCYAFIQTEGFCMRANNLAIYAEANRQIMGKIMPCFQRERTESTSKVDKQKVGVDSLIGEGTKIGDKSLIKRSVIGRNCQIGEKVKITNSILMDNVIIHENVQIQGTVLGSNCKINPNSDLKDCLVGYNQDIVTSGKYCNETIQDFESFMED